MPESPRTPWEAEADVGGIDVVEEASKESFPASDAPGWAVGQSYFEAQQEEASAAEERPPHPRCRDGRSRRGGGEPDLTG